MRFSLWQFAISFLILNKWAQNIILESENRVCAKMVLSGGMFVAKGILRKNSQEIRKFNR